MADQATIEAWHAEAEAALHRLATGSMTETVVYGDQRVTYTSADVGRLKAYIAELEGRLAVLKGLPRRAPIYMEF